MRRSHTEALHAQGRLPGLHERYSESHGETLEKAKAFSLQNYARGVSVGATPTSRRRRRSHTEAFLRSGDAVLL